MFGPRSAGIRQLLARLGAVCVTVAIVVFGTVVGFVAPAAATWSIVVVDPGTGRVGAVMASCVPAGVLGNSDQTLVPIVLIPGRAAAVTQGTINPDSPIGVRQLLADGVSPRETIDSLLEIDDQPTARQFGIAAAFPDSANPDRLTVSAVAHTGQDAAPERGDRTLVRPDTAPADDPADDPAAVPPLAVSVQGVLLADQAVLDRSLNAFTASLDAGEGLEEALVAGLVAGSEAGGDRRCGDQTALFAHLVVAEPGDDPLQPSRLLTVTVDEGDGQNPVMELAAAQAAGQSGWVDIGLNDPLGIPRVAVLAFGTALAVAAFFVLRKGMGSPSARR